MQNKLRLLVSVSSVYEAIEAYKGGADIIDVKNPKEGALGASFPWIIKEVRENLGQKVQISATIGDMPNLPGTASLAAVGAATSGANYVKIGLFGLNSEDDALYMMKKVMKSMKEFNTEVKVVAAAYADYLDFGGLSPLLLPEIAHQAGADIVLIDIKNKGSLNLFDYLNSFQLQSFVERAHEFKLLVTFAGRLEKKHILKIRECGADIIGVRRSVCDNNNFESGKVDKILVNNFAKTMRENLSKN